MTKHCHHIQTDSILNGSDCTETEKEAVCGLLQECLYHVDVIMMLKHDPNNTYTRMLTSFEQHSLRIKEKLAKGVREFGHKLHIK